MFGAKSMRSGPRRKGDPPAPERRTATADTPPDAPPPATVKTKNFYGIPRRLLRILLVIIAVLGLVMLFRDPLEGSFTGLVRMARSDRPMTLLEAAPRLGLLLGRKPASAEEFTALCRHAPPKTLWPRARLWPRPQSGNNATRAPQLCIPAPDLLGTGDAPSAAPTAPSSGLSFTASGPNRAYMACSTSRWPSSR